MTTFLLNPYDAELDLNAKDDRRLFTEASKGIKSEEKGKSFFFMERKVTGSDLQN